MSSLFGGGGASRANQPTVPLPTAAVAIQTSIQGRPKAIGWGTGLLAGNIIYLNDFQPVLVANYTQGPATSGGKGGLFGSRSGGSGNPTYSWTYYVNVFISLCEGPIQGILSFTGDGMTLSHYGDNTGGAHVFVGTQDQGPMGELVTAHPDQARAYRGEAYLAYWPMFLGENTAVPNFQYEVKFGIAGVGPFDLDADPAAVIADYLTNAQYGIPGFPPDLLGDLSQYSAFCIANSLVVSPLISDQTEAGQFLTTLMQATYSEIVWSSGRLTVAPYGDMYVNGNGVEFTPITTPVYYLAPDDFLPLQGGEGGGSSVTPIAITRKSEQDRINRVRLEFLDRANKYTPAEVDDRDEGSIEETRERPSDVREMHLFKRIDSASMSASFQLLREQVAVSYSFTLPKTFVLLDLMDLVTLPLDAFGLSATPQAVRIKEITENSDYSLTFIAEDWHGPVASPLYNRQTAVHAVPDFNADPGGINPPIFFEPPDALGGGLFVYAGISGVNPDVWGGADIYVSTDGTNYTKVGQVLGASRMGYTTADLPQVIPAVVGPSIDQFNTLSVDLTESGGELGSGTDTDMRADATVCYVGSTASARGELLSYRDAGLIAPNHYNLLPLHRGAYGSDIIDHPAGSPFVRIDGRVAKIPYDQTRIGRLLYIKFVSFNVYQGGRQTLDQVGAYIYSITGSSLTSSLPDVSSAWSVFKSQFAEIWWQDIEDFRSGIRYLVKKGVSYSSALLVGDQAHPPFIAFGEGTYWIVGYYVAPSGVVTFSTNPASISIVGNMLVENIILTSDQQANDWLGTRVRLTPAGTAPARTLGVDVTDVFTVSDVFSPTDVFLAGGGGTSATGTYTIPSSDIIDIGYLARVNINVTWSAAGVPLGADILSLPDFLAAQDILASAYAANVSAYPEIQASADGTTFGSWQRFVPGMYQGRKFNFRMQVTTNDARVTALLTGFKIQISVIPRTDHYQNLTSTTGISTITFRPDGAASNAGFNGGPNGAALPYWNASWSQTAGDIFVVTALSKTAMSWEILNGGAPVVRSGVNIDVQGY
jgi:hypothetical protein